MIKLQAKNNSAYKMSHEQKRQKRHKDFSGQKHPNAATQAMSFVSLGGSFHNNAYAGRSIGRYIGRLDGAEVVVNNFDFVLLGPTSL